MPSRPARSGKEVRGNSRPPLSRGRAELKPRSCSPPRWSPPRCASESSGSGDPPPTGYGYKDPRVVDLVDGSPSREHSRSISRERRSRSRSQRGASSSTALVLVSNARVRRSRSRSRRKARSRERRDSRNEETSLVLRSNTEVNSRADARTSASEKDHRPSGWETDARISASEKDGDDFREYCQTAAAAMSAAVIAGKDAQEKFAFPRVSQMQPLSQVPQVSHLSAGLGLSNCASAPLLPKSNNKKKKREARIGGGDLGSMEAQQLRAALVNAIGVSGEGLKDPQNVQDAVVSFLRLFRLGETESLADFAAACALVGSIDALRLVLGQLQGNIAPDGRSGRTAITFPLYQRVCDHLILSTSSEFANDALLALLGAGFAPCATEFLNKDVLDYFIRHQHFVSLEFAEDMRALIAQSADGRGTPCKVSPSQHLSKGPYGKGGHVNEQNGLYDVWPLSGSRWGVKSDRFQTFACHYNHGPQDVPGRGDVLLLKIEDSLAVGVIQSGAGRAGGAVTVAIQQIRVLQQALYKTAGVAMVSVGPSKVALDRMRAALVELCRRTTQIPAMQYWLVTRKPTPIRKQTSGDKKTLRMHLRLRPREGQSLEFESQAATSTKGFSPGKITGELLFLSTNPHGARECAPDEAKGKIIVFWRGAVRPEKQARHAAAGGAVGVVVVDDDDASVENGEIDSDKDTVFISFPSGKSPGLKLQEEGGQITIASIEVGSPATGRVFEGDIVIEVNGSTDGSLESWRQLFNRIDGEPPSALFKVNNELEGRAMLPVVMVRREDGHKMIFEAMSGAVRPVPPLAEIVVSEYGAAADLSFRMNQSQLEAIKEALAPNLKPKIGRTSLIQGPPGTGKTTVALQIIESWLQKPDMQFSKDGAAPATQILVTGFSNVAIDNIGLGLQRLGLGPFLRIGRGNTILSKDTLQEQMLEHPSYGHLERLRISFATMGADAVKLERKISRELMARARIILATCVTSGGDMLAGFHFKRILFDEATQATEAASVVPITKGCEELVLIGDHKQLPPLIHAPKSLEFGLHESLFERLLRLGVPAQLLSVQYRMHPAIAAFPSMTFYDNRVTNGVWAASRPAPMGYSWPDPHSPICFEGIGGPEDVLDEKVGTSVKNAIEAERVFSIVDALVLAGDVPTHEIGVITPYSGQASLLRTHLRSKGVSVATVDSYQGRETDVIICSTVRCSPKRGIGFLSDRRRFNVLLTRARRGVIVVGHETTLRLDPCWSDWIGHVTQHRLFKDNLAQSHLPARPAKHGFDVPLETDMSKVPEEILARPGKWMAFAKPLWPTNLEEAAKSERQLPRPAAIADKTKRKSIQAFANTEQYEEEPNGISATVLALADAQAQSGEAVSSSSLKIGGKTGATMASAMQRMMSNRKGGKKGDARKVGVQGKASFPLRQRASAAAASVLGLPMSLQDRVNHIIKAIGHVVVPKPFFLQSGAGAASTHTCLLTLTGMVDRSPSVQAEGRASSKEEAERLCYRRAWTLLTGEEPMKEVAQPRLTAWETSDVQLAMPILPGTSEEVGGQTIEADDELVFLPSSGVEFPPPIAAFPPPMPMPPAMPLNIPPAPEALRVRESSDPQSTMPNLSLGQLKQQLSRFKKVFPGGRVPLDFKQEGPPHAPVFTYFVDVALPAGVVQVQGRAKTKKEAERLCLAEALGLLS